MLCQQRRSRVRVRIAATDGWRQGEARGAGGATPFGEVRSSPNGSSGPPASGAVRRSPGSLTSVTTLALLGGGKMGEALLGGLIDGGWDPENLVVAEVSAERRHAIEGRFPKARVVPNPAWAVAEAEVVVVATKPADVG